MTEEYSTEMSGEGSDCYETVYKPIDPYLYNDEPNANMNRVNMGYHLIPLDSEIYGPERALESKKKFMEKSRIF